MAFDVVSNRVVLFGGRAGNVKLNDTWKWNGSTWDKLNLPLGSSPKPRSHHILVSDPIHNRLVLFGGQKATGGQFGDTWVWNGNNWSNVASPPPGRMAQGGTYDVDRERLVMFGGSNGNSQTRRDTWELK
jgi:hypothetical protein